MASIGYATLQVIPSLRGMQTEVQRQLSPLARSSSSVGQQSGRSFAGAFSAAVGNVARSVGRTLETGITGAAVVAGGMAATAFATGFSRVTTIQDATASLTITLGDAAAAADLLGDVLEVVRGTPFNLDQFAAAAQVMAGMGIEAQKIPTYLTAIGEASATQGSRANEFAERLSTIFGQIAAQGQLSLSDVWRISETGVNALAILANHFGLTRDEMKDMISSGAVPAGEALDALARGILEGSDGVAGATIAMSGNMAALRDTLSGARGGFGAALARFGANVIEPFTDLLTSGFTAAAEVIDAFGTRLGDFLNQVASGNAAERIAGWLEGLPERIDPFLERIRELAPALAPVLGALAGIASTNLAGALGPLGALVPSLGPLGGIMIALVATTPELRDALAGVAAAAAPVVGQIAQALAPALEALGPIVATIAGSLGELLVAALEQIAPLVPTVVDLFVVLGQELVELLPSLVQIGVTLLEALVPAIEALLPVAVALAPALIGIAQALAAVIAAAPPGLIQAVVGAFLAFQGVRAVTGPIQSVGSALETVTSIAGTRGVSRLAAFRGVLASSISESSRLSGPLSALRSGFASMTSAAGSAVSTVGNWARTAGSTAVSAARSLGSAVGSAASAMAGWVRQAALAVANTARATAAWVAHRAALIAGRVAQMAATAAQAALNAVMAMNPITLVVIALAALVAGLVLAYQRVEWFRDLVDGAFSAIREIVAGVVDFVVGVWSTLVDVLATPISIAVGIVTGLFDTVLSVISGVFGWVQTNWPLLLAIITGPIGMAVLIVTRHWDTIKNAFTSVKNWIRDRVNDIVGFITGIPDRISDAASTMWNGIKDAFKAVLNTIIGWWNGLEFTLGPWTIGKLTVAGRTIFPGATIGPYTFGVPDIPYLHTGGIFRAADGGSEGLAVLRTGEGVFTRDQMAALGMMAARPAGVTVVIDGNDRLFIEWLRRMVRIEGGGDVQVALGGVGA